ITGVGLATPIGRTFDELSTNLMAGRSGVGRVTHFDPVDQPCQVAACLGPMTAPDGWDPADFSRLGPWEQVLVWTAVNALRDAGLAGACDRSVTPMGMAGFGNLGALTKRNDAPEAASRPFDRGRDGFVMGEGGAMFVLERGDRARRRGARAYGAVAGVGATSD